MTAGQNSGCEISRGGGMAAGHNSGFEISEGGGMFADRIPPIPRVLEIAT